MTKLEKRLEKLEEKHPEGQTHYIWINEGEEATPPPNASPTDEVVYIRWMTDEDEQTSNI